jgi:hypothetical protein
MIVVMGGTLVLRGERNMAKTEELKEQRKHKRFSPKDLVFAVSERSLFGVGTLVNISGGGVAFQYTYDSGYDWDLLKGSMKLDLFKSKPSHNVVGIDCNVVYDTAVPWKIGVFSNYQLRRCGVEFGELSRDQSSALDLFIKGFTVEGS